MRYDDVIEAVLRWKERDTGSTSTSSLTEAEAVEETGSVTRYLKLVKPAEFADAEQIVACMMARERLVLNLEQLKPEDMHRLMDYIGGAVQALRYSLQRMSQTSFLLARGTDDVRQEQL